jgi:7-carboxy-7-deazaguanine synthase
MGDGQKFPVVEIFGPTMQGEGAMCGKRSHFLRLGGCDFRCTWCDSMHAVDPNLVKANSDWLLPREIESRLEALPPSPWITISGGNPVIWDLIDLVLLLNPVWKLAVETQGSQYRDWVKECQLVTVSPKGPSSGMLHMFHMSQLEPYAKLAREWNPVPVNFKVVVFNGDDLEFAREIHREFPQIPFFLSVGTHQDPELASLRWDICSNWRVLVEKVLRMNDLADVTVLPQTHVLLWGHDRAR